MKSTLYSLNAKDFLRGLLMAVLVPVLLVIQQSVAAGSLVFNWQAIGIAAVSGFVAYLLKNFLTDDTKAAISTVEKAGGEVQDTSGAKITVENNKVTRVP